jgi:SAM-dependent methyltransferase
MSGLGWAPGQGDHAPHTSGAVDMRAFVEEHLPPAPRRVLEVGCGRGDLARLIAGLGYNVVAIDHDAPEGEIFRSVSLEDFADPEVFDAVVAVRALHHIPDVAAAVAKMARLVRSGGRLLVHEHAWEHLDEPTARWYLEQRRARGPGAPPTVDRCMDEWSEDHRDLHTSATMLAAIEPRFTQRYFTWTPYLYGELGPVVTDEQEQALIAAGTIQATGFNYVGERRETLASR